MKYIGNIFLYFLIAFMVLQNHLIVAAILVLVFTYRAGAIWLVPLAVCIDGYFGAFYHVPYISLVTLIWYGVSEIIRPRLIMRYKEYEKAA